MRQARYETGTVRRDVSAREEERWPRVSHFRRLNDGVSMTWFGMNVWISRDQDCQPHRNISYIQYINCG